MAYNITQFRVKTLNREEPYKKVPEMATKVKAMKIKLMKVVPVDKKQKKNKAKTTSNSDVR